VVLADEVAGRPFKVEPQLYGKAVVAEIQAVCIGDGNIIIRTIKADIPESVAEPLPDGAGYATMFSLFTS